MADDLQLIAAIQRARANDDPSGPRGVGVVDPGQADGTRMLPRDAIGSRGRELEELRVTRNIEPGLRQHGIEAEGTARPGLAVKAMTGIGARQLRRREPIAYSPAATATFDHVTALPVVSGSEWILEKVLDPIFHSMTHESRLAPGHCNINRPDDVQDHGQYDDAGEEEHEGHRHGVIGDDGAGENVDRITAPAAHKIEEPLTRAACAVDDTGQSLGPVDQRQDDKNPCDHDTHDAAPSLRQ